MKVDAVLLEFEGIVVDTQAARRDALVDAFGAHGVALTTEDYWDCCAGYPMPTGIRNLAASRALTLDDTALDLITLRAERTLGQYLAKGALLVDGARSAIERLAARHRLGVVSHMRRADIESIIALARLEHAFAFVVGSEDTTRAKPDPAPYALAMQRLGRFRVGEATTVAALEFGIAGIRAARAAGLPCVAVGALPMHVAMEATAWIPSLNDLTSTDLATLIARGERP